jgi:predicted pyridoxine 5'-phosphate oxidase superfamily flavin-nucleotide-binding protein
VQPANQYSSDLAFTPSVKAAQTRKGSRRAYARMEEAGGWPKQITPDLKSFIESQMSIFLATANDAGQPYVQHRGGPAGFLKVLDEETIGFVDFSGNRQFVTTGNLLENPRAQLFLIDYENQQRVKIWGTASIVDNDRELIERLMPRNYPARSEQVVLFSVLAWDANCSKHIPRRLEVADVQRALEERDQRIENLELEIARLSGRTR